MKKCKECKKQVLGGKWVKNGAKDEQYFCGLTCFEKYYKKRDEYCKHCGHAMKDGMCNAPLSVAD